MTTLTNTLEGGTNGTTISTANSGGTSGTAFGTVQIDSGATLVYDTAQHAHGSVGARVATSTTAASSYVAWTTGLSGTSTTAWARAYFRFSANPSAAVNLLRILSSSNAIMGTVRVNANGTLGMLYGSGTLASTSTGSLTAGQWFRIEVMVTAGTTTGVMTCRIYWTPDGTTPDQTLTISNVNTGSANPVRLRVGCTTSLANVAAFHFDDLGFSDTDWVGPASGGGGSTPADVYGTLYLRNTFNGGTPGGDITDANSGGTSGDPLYSAFLATYSSTNATGNRGPLVCRLADPSAYVRWQDYSIAGRTLWFRVLVRLAALPASTAFLASITDSGFSNSLDLEVDTSGRVLLANTSGTTLATTTTSTIPTGTWVRIEAKVVIGTTTTNGAVELRLYTDADSTTAAQTVTVTSVNTGTAIPTRFTISAPPSGAWDVDDIALTDTGWPGPPTGGLSKTNSFSGGSDGTGITDANSGGTSGNAFTSWTGSPSFTSTNATGYRAPLVGRLRDATVANQGLIWSVTPAGRALWTRTYLYLPAAPSSDSLLIHDTDLLLNLYVTTSRTISVRGGGFTPPTYLTTVTALPTGQWCRIEAEFLYGPGTPANGATGVRIYTSADSTTPDEIKSATSIDVGTTLPTSLTWGSLTGTDAYVDDLAVTDMGWPGPAPAPAVVTTPFRGWGLIPIR